MIKDLELVKLIFGLKVAYLRRELNMSYQQLSDQTGMAISYLHNIEKGKKYPKADKILTLAQALHTDYNYLVSLDADKKLKPIIDLLTSDFLKIFPLEQFGINMPKLIELLAYTPSRINAFISTVLKITRTYHLQGEDFYKAALRSYQDLHDNYFPELESAANQVRLDWNLSIIPNPERLQQILREAWGVHVNYEAIGEKALLQQRVRSFFAPETRTLYINPTFKNGPQELMLLAKEIGFQQLKTKERPFITRMTEVNNFEELLNDFRASYFAVALLMEEQSVVHNIHELAAHAQWEPQFILDFLSTYKVSQEMFLQRLANLLPRHFGINDIFFIRFFAKPDMKKFDMTKEMHLSQLHNPYANQREEHYCRRWVSVDVIRQFLEQNQENEIAAAQVSSYINTDHDYLCLSLAKASTDAPGCSTSVTMGMLVNEKLRETFRWIDDPNLPVKKVHTTCERCPIADCDVRVAPPAVLQLNQAKADLKEALDILRKKKPEELQTR